MLEREKTDKLHLQSQNSAQVQMVAASTGRCLCSVFSCQLAAEHQLRIVFT